MGEVELRAEDLRRAAHALGRLTGAPAALQLLAMALLGQNGCFTLADAGAHDFRVHQGEFTKTLACGQVRNAVDRASRIAVMGHTALSSHHGESSLAVAG